MSQSEKPATIVVKLGTSTLTDGSGCLDRGFLPCLADQLCALMEAGHRVVLVTSGAVRAGVERLGWAQRPRAIVLRQVAAAVGQGRLMAEYESAFQVRGRVVAQVLLTRQLAQDRTRYVNAQNTLNALLSHGVLPIVNENDTVAVEELQFGDNDTLAALVAALVRADLLILLTNVEGLLDREGRLIPEVTRVTDDLRRLAGGAGRHGSGGMITKLRAAEIAGAAGVRTVIAHGRRPNVIGDAVAGVAPGTCFLPPARRLRGRKHWLAYGCQPRGRLVVNHYAHQALVLEHKSLLPVGITDVTGTFASGETVSLHTEEGREFARGLATYNWRDTQRLMGLRTERVAELLGPGATEEVIHRDNLVILEHAGDPETAPGGPL